jgi:hypothetical protein
MIIVYIFIGKLPVYIIDTIKQTRMFYSGEIILIIDDIQSEHLKNLHEYNVILLPYQEYINKEFLDTVNSNINKFCIAHKIGDRKLLFIRSFERFFILEKFLDRFSQEDILFLELDMLIYFKPEELLPLFRRKEITFSYVQNKKMCSGFSYIKSSTILKEMNEYFLEFIKTSDTFIAEMIAIGNWIEKPEIKERVSMLPGLWKDEKYNSMIWEEFDAYNQTLFDGSGIGILVDGPDDSHIDEWLSKNKIWWGNEVIYNDYEYEWREIDGKRYLYLKNDKGDAFKIQCIHVHNKKLHKFLSA